MKAVTVPTHHHVVEVRHDEVGVGQVDVRRQRAEEDAGQAADGEQDQEGRWRRASASPELMLPLYMVVSQLNTLTPEGIATRKVKRREDHGRQLAIARRRTCGGPRR